MANKTNIRQGLKVYDNSKQYYGMVERVEGNQFYVQGHPFPLNAVSQTSDDAIYLVDSMSKYDQNQLVIPVIEEELQVGKRQVESGGVRVSTQMSEKPVEAQVKLREEQVQVDRYPVNRPVTNADMAALQEGAIEVTTTAEQPVVSKQARVVEEVGLNKTAEEHTETIRDKVRQSEVEVQQISGQTATRAGNLGFEDYNSDFQNHFQTNFGQSRGGNSQMNYQQYAPIYRYGYELAGDQRYSGRDWSQIESQVQKDWQTKNPQTPWERVKGSVRYGWDKAHGTVSGGSEGTSRSSTDQM